MLINITHKNKLMKVLEVIPSLKRKLTPKAYTNIPIPNPINLAGHNNPSKASTVYLVPQI